MLNSFLQERFVMANIVKNCNLEIEKVKSISEKRLEGLRRYKTEKVGYETHINQILDNLPQLITLAKNSTEPANRALAQKIDSIISDYNLFLGSNMIVSQEPLRILDDLSLNDERINSLLRTKDAEIEKLKDQLFGATSSKIAKSSDYNRDTILNLQNENTSLKNEVSRLTSQLNDPRINASSDVRMKNLSEQVIKLEQDKVDLQNELRNTSNELKTKLNIAYS